MCSERAVVSDLGAAFVAERDRVSALRAELAGHRPAGRREQLSCVRVMEALERLPRPFDREAGHVHVTGSAVVVGVRGTVLHRHKRLGLWLQPGGHVDAGEIPSETALRETLEETGLTAEHPAGRATLVHVDVHRAGAHLHLDLRYLLVAGDGDPVPGPGESQAVAWFTWKAAMAVADISLGGALRAAAVTATVQALAEQ